MFFTDISYVVHPVGRITPNGITLLGTAFFINKPGLLATAAHVVDNNDNGLVIIMNKVNSIQDYLLIRNPSKNTVNIHTFINRFCSCW